MPFPDVIPSTEALLRTAVEHHTAGRLAEAEAAYRAVLDACPSDVNALHLLGIAMRQGGEVDEALRLIGLAVALVPWAWEPLANLASVLDEDGRPAEAHACRLRLAALGGTAPAAPAARPDAPLVSVLIPVYEREALLPETVASVLAQDLTDLEVVIVDNASSDGTWDVCRGLAAADPRVRIFRNDTNVGPVRNWQCCIAEARGRYGKILFSDDRMAPDFLSRTVPYMVCEDIGFAYTGGMVVTPEYSLRLFGFPTTYPMGVIPSEVYLERALFSVRNHIHSPPVTPSCGLFRMTDLRRNVLDSLPGCTLGGFADCGAGVDALIYLLTARSHPYVAWVNEPLVTLLAGGITDTLVREGRFHAYYDQAACWFAARAPETDLGGMLMARAWNHEISRRGSLVVREEIHRNFGVAPAVIPTSRAAR